jgi:ubiquinone/menaquinone biosynthesis C-methylase UbiE
MALLYFLFWVRRMTRRAALETTSAHAASVGRFYDEHGDAFLQVYGDVIQAFRTRDVSGLLDSQARAMGLQKGMRVLDAGCGVCGPALYFAKNYGVRVDAVTVSEKQAAAAADKILRAGLSGQVTVTPGDYHQLPSIFPGSEYDVVYFLESFGHSANKALAIDAAWKMLKPGGLLFIKDLFVKEAALPGHARQIRRNVSRIDTAYRYRVSDLCAVLKAFRRQGFILSSLRTIDIPLEDFENLSISNQFQELTGINRIDDLQSYVFPVDFFELSGIKPWYDPNKGSNRYFLQNLYYVQVLNHSQDEL